jgi:amidase
VARLSTISLGIGLVINTDPSVTVNPHNNKLSCGGSSGGEGALIALRGSILGLGTDIGGSIRIPAGFNGLCGIRPSHGRMPYNMLANSMEGQETIHSGQTLYIFVS